MNDQLVKELLSTLIDEIGRNASAVSAIGKKVAFTKFETDAAISEQRPFVESLQAKLEDAFRTN